MNKDEIKHTEWFEGGIGGIKDCTDEMNSFFEGKEQQKDVNSKLQARANNQQRALQLAYKQQFTPDEEEEFANLLMYKPELKVETEPLLTTHNGLGLFRRANVSSVVGASGNGKSFVSSIFMASVLGWSNMGLTATKSDYKVLYYDTEQEDRDIEQVINRVYRLSNKIIEVASVSEHTDKRVRLRGLESLIKKIKPDFVVVDGITDLLSSINDEAESNAVMTHIRHLSMTYNCHILNVIHTAKTAETKGGRGHIGSVLTNKASHVFEVVRKDNIYNVVNSKMRGQNHMDDIVFAIDEKGLPFNANSLIEEKKQQQLNEKIDTERQEWQSVFGKEHYLTYNEIITALMTKYNLKKSGAESRYKRALQMGILSRNVENKIYVVLDNQRSNVQERSK